VDGERPGVDHARRGRDGGVVGNDLTGGVPAAPLLVARRWSEPRAWPLGIGVEGCGGRCRQPAGGSFYPPAWLTGWSGRPRAAGGVDGPGQLALGGGGRLVMARGQGMRRLGLGRSLAGVLPGVALSAGADVRGHYRTSGRELVSLGLLGNRSKRGGAGASSRSCAWCSLRSGGDTQEWYYLVSRPPLWAWAMRYARCLGGGALGRRAGGLGGSAGLSLGWSPSECCPEWGDRRGRSGGAGVHYSKDKQLSQQVTPRPLPPILCQHLLRPVV